MSFMNTDKIGILGDGAMAVAIAHLLDNNRISHETFSRKLENVSKITECNLVFACVPSSALVEISSILQNINVISCAKGVATETQPFISSFFAQENFCVLSGPNFAHEITQNHQTITTIASKNIRLTNAVQSLLMFQNFIVETTQNVHGVEICGIVKNVIAIAMGYASEKIPSWNEKALMLTKMFQEMIIVLEHFKCEKDVIGLSCGIGDIFLTCSTVNSRNFQFGANLGKTSQETWSPCDLPREASQNVINREKSTQNITIEGIRSSQFLKTLPINIPILRSFINFIE